MADSTTESKSLGTVYARALIAMAQQNNVLPEVTDDVRSIKELADTNPGFAQFLAAPTIGDDERLAALKKIFEGRVSPYTLQTLDAMARRERLVFIGGFFAAFEDVLAHLAGQVDVELTSALEMDGAAMERIGQAVGKALGQQPNMTVKVDSSLIGGLRLRIDDTLIDGSVQTQLERVRKALRQGGGNAVQQRAASIIGN